MQQSHNTIESPCFRSWVLTTLDHQAAQYRATCEAVVNTCREYAAGNIWLPKHTAIGVSCLPVQPAIPKYPGEVSDEDKQWYVALRKPDYNWMREEAVRRITSLET